MNAAQKRQKAINILRGTGMTDDEIAAELGIGSLDELTEVSNVIDAEVVEVENDSASDNLPALIPHGVGERMDRRYPPKEGRTPDGRSTNKENVAQYDSLLADHAERRCVATNAKGERCRRFSISGSTVCKTHGGSTRAVMNKARIRLEMAANRLVGKELEFAFDDTKPPAVQLDAVKDSLNRVGLVKPAQVEFGPIKPYEEIFDGIASVTREDSRKSRGVTDDSFDLVDYQQDSFGNGVDYQRDSSHDVTTPAPATGEQPPEPGRSDQAGRSYDRPEATHSRERRSQRSVPNLPAVIGLDAIRAANEANRDRR